MSPRRVWVFRLLSATLAPALFLCLLEGGLRLFGYGYPTDFFLPIGGRIAWTTNQRFGWQFFPPAIARWPEVCEIPFAKDENTCRIFIVGESAAEGVPEPAFGFARMLEAKLRERYPGVRFEVVNSAMTAINSTVIIPIALQCAEKKADVVIVYNMGNNEVIGPFGPGTVLAGYSSSDNMIRASIFVRTWRTGQLLQNVLRRDGYADKAAIWESMAAFTGHDVTADDPRLETVYKRSRANHRAICSSARALGATMLHSTVAVNLKDCAPLSAVHAADLDAARREACDGHCRAGQVLAAQGNHQQAAAEFRQAIAADDLRTYMGMARVYRRMNDPPKAIETIHRAVAAMPDNADADCALGNSLVQCGQLSEAADAFRVALRLAPDHLEAGHSFGVVLERTGRTTEAIEQYRRVLQSHPDSSLTKDALKRLTGHSS